MAIKRMPKILSPEVSRSSGHPPELPAHGGEQGEQEERKTADAMEQEMMGEAGADNFFNLAKAKYKELGDGGNKNRERAYAAFTVVPKEDEEDTFGGEKMSYAEKMNVKKERKKEAIEEMYELFALRNKALKALKKFVKEVVQPDFASGMKETHVDISLDDAILKKVTEELTNKLLEALDLEKDEEEIKEIKEEIEKKIAAMEECEQLNEEVKQTKKAAEYTLRKYGMDKDAVQDTIDNLALAQAIKEKKAAREAYEAAGAFRKFGRGMALIGKGLGRVIGIESKTSAPEEVTPEEEKKLAGVMGRAYLDNISLIDDELNKVRTHLEHISTITTAQEKLRKKKRDVLEFTKDSDTVRKHFQDKLKGKMVELLPEPTTGGPATDLDLAGSKVRAAAALHERMVEHGGTEDDKHVHYLKGTHEDANLNARLEKANAQVETDIKDEAKREVDSLTMAKNPENELFTKLKKLILKDPEKIDETKRLVDAQLCDSAQEYADKVATETDPDKKAEASRRNNIINKVSIRIEEEKSLRSWEQGKGE